MLKSPDAWRRWGYFTTFPSCLLGDLWQLKHRSSNKLLIDGTSSTHPKGLASVCSTALSQKLEMQHTLDNYIQDFSQHRSHSSGSSRAFLSFNIVIKRFCSWFWLQTAGGELIPAFHCDTTFFLMCPKGHNSHKSVGIHNECFPDTFIFFFLLFFFSNDEDYAGHPTAACYVWAAPA